ncbi:MAG: hypothetical protein GXO64_04220 [Candidatus Micrarchaeota archaeon]|nr:hypothetical protein [Candidatus Micrarchaeota archaeon]
MREKAISRIRKNLDSMGFITSECTGCIDIISQKKETYFIKVLKNLDSLTASEASNLKVASYFISATPIVIADKTRTDSIKGGVVHERFGISGISEKTFFDYADGILPHIASAKSGKFVVVDGKRILKRLNEMGIGIGTFAEEVGISKHTARRYIEGGRHSIELCLRIEKFLGINIVRGFNLESYSAFDSLGPTSVFEKYLSRKINSMNINFSFIHRSAFNFVMKDGNKRTIARVSDNITFIKRNTMLLKNISDNLGLESIVITKQTRYDKIDGLPVMRLKDINNMKSKNDFYSFIESLNLN